MSATTMRTAVSVSGGAAGEAHDRSPRSPHDPSIAGTDTGR
jgi:hypothetical protein